MANTINAGAIVTAWSEYTNDVGNMDAVHDAVMNQLETELDMATVVETDQQILKHSQASFGEVIQAFQKEFTPKGQLTLTPDEIRLRRVKVDIEFYPDEVYNGWTRFLVSNKSLNRIDWPITRYIAEVWIPKAISRDLHNNFYGAKYVAPTAGTAGAASASFDGLKVAIAAGVTASKITPQAMGAPSATAATFATQIETFAASIPELYRSTEMSVNMNKTLFIRHRAGNRSKYNQYWEQSKDQSAIMDYDSQMVVGRTTLAGVNTIFATPKSNLIIAFNPLSHTNDFQLEQEDRRIKGWTEFEVGVGFINPSLFWVNDQDITFA